jgi:hypothetical protein
MIPWLALASPKSDGSDTAVILEQAGFMSGMARLGTFRLQALVRDLDFVPKNKPFLRTAEHGLPAEAEMLLAAWPVAQRMAEDLLAAVYPCDDSRRSNKPDPWYRGGCYGCKSDNLADFGHVYGTVVDAVGFVEGIVASLANWKLYALGVAHERWDKAFLNIDPAEKFEFPLRPSEQVEAGSVIHHVWCFAHMLGYHQALLALPAPPRGASFGARQAATRLQRGMHIIEDRLMPRATRDSADFLFGLLRWGQELLDVALPADGE